MSAAKMVKEENREQRRGRAQVEDFVLQNKIKLIILTKVPFEKGINLDCIMFSHECPS